MVTCAEIRTQLAPLLRDADDLASEVVSDRGDLQELLSEAGQVNPTILAKAKDTLAAAERKLLALHPLVPPIFRL